MSSSNENLEKAAMLILIESNQFKFVRSEMARILSEFRSGESSCYFSPHYILDVYLDESGSISGNDIDYEDGKYIVEYP